jgi:hypothetical protein
VTTRYDKVTVTIRCTECRLHKPIQRTKNSRRRYCDDCQPIVLKRRKKLERERRSAEPKNRPRLVRYAGYDPSEHH